MRIHVEFSGGLELLFDKKTQLDLDFSAADGQTVPKTMKDLVQHLKTKHLKEKPELFVQGDTVRPGILVLVNDTDWELCDGIDYVLQDKDSIIFLSTLHGGQTAKNI